METSIRIDLSGVAEVDRQLARLRGAELQKALYMALNKTGAKAQTQADRMIRERFNISRDQVRGSFVFTRAKQGTTGAEAVLRIFGSPTKVGRSMNMVRFLERSVTLAEARKRVKQGTQNKLRFKILRRGGGLKTIDGAFLGNKGRTVFERTGDKRLPIRAVTTIDIPQMFNTRRINRKVVQVMAQRFPDIFASEAAYFLRRFNGGGR